MPLDRRVRKELSNHIIPSTQDIFPSRQTFSWRQRANSEVVTGIKVICRVINVNPLPAHIVGRTVVHAKSVQIAGGSNTMKIVGQPDQIVKKQLLKGNFIFTSCSLRKLL